MKKITKRYWGILWLFGWSLVFAGKPSVPDKVEALKKMYPEVRDAVWTQMEQYEVAVFTVDGFEEKVWFDPDAVWVMTQTDWGNIDRVPPAVFNSFATGGYADWTVAHVFSVRLPDCPDFVVIQISQPNSEEAYQLFYNSGGALLGRRDVSDVSDALRPDFFGC